MLWDVIDGPIVGYWALLRSLSYDDMSEYFIDKPYIQMTI